MELQVTMWTVCPCQPDGGPPFTQTRKKGTFGQTEVEALTGAVDIGI
jgi:hypothetical protein